MLSFCPFITIDGAPINDIHTRPPHEEAPNFQEIFLIPTYHNSEFDIFICIVAIS